MKIRYFLVLAWLALASPAIAAQGTGCMPTTGTVSGLTMAQDMNAGIAALISSNSGASAPSTDCTAVPIKGQVWLNTSVTPNVLQQYDGTSWVFLGALDSSNHLWAPPVGGGAATIASSSGVTDIWANVASSITVSGTNAITALASADAMPGTVKVVTASGAFTLTNGAPMALPSGANITAAPGDRFLAVALTNTNVAVFAYTRADGSAIVNPSVPMGTSIYGIYGTIPPKTVYGTGQALSRASYPGYLAAVTRAQTGTLTAGNNTITSVGNTAGLGAGMPLEGTGIPAGATIASVTSSTIVMSTTATANGAQIVTAFLPGYGSGGDSTTVGVMDCRGRMIAGRDPSSTVLSSATAINSPQGSQSQTLTAAQIPTITSANGSQSIVTSFNGAQIPYTAGGAIVNGFLPSPGGAAPNIGPNSNAAWNGLTSTTTLNTINVTSSNTGGTAHPIVPPIVTAECVVVVLP
jgi:hypothetical protein